MINIPYTNRKAFLDMIAFSEGTSTHPLTKCQGYDVIVTGEDGVLEVFTDFKEHPFMHRKPKLINGLHQLYSSARGRYQQMVHWWPSYRSQLTLQDFGPDSQDVCALQQIRECHALPLIDGGDVRDAIRVVSHLWASLPGANYEGQHMRPYDRLVAAYEQAGGAVA
ncbi:MAG: glycoside hydrolase family protein [Chamaesiphon sp.]